MYFLVRCVCAGGETSRLGNSTQCIPVFAVHVFLIFLRIHCMREFVFFFAENGQRSNAFTSGQPVYLEISRLRWWWLAGGRDSSFAMLRTNYPL